MSLRSRSAFNGGGQTDARMGWLYETFAKHVIDELTGKRTESPSDSPRNSDVPTS